MGHFSLSTELRVGATLSPEVATMGGGKLESGLDLELASSKVKHTFPFLVSLSTFWVYFGVSLKVD